MKIKLIDSAKLPTPFAEFTLIGFEEIETHKEHIALTLGNINSGSAILTRIHSECLTGDALFSLRCDCGFQLHAALEHIAKQGRGILLYHRQEGRNIGLLNKIRAYHLQDEGLDTVEANLKLGFKADERDYSVCADMLALLNVDTIDLLTNNPKKIEVLENVGVHINRRIPLEVGDNPNNHYYLLTKKKKMGHLFSHL